MNETAFSQQTQTANKKSPRRGHGKARAVTLNKSNRLNAMLSYLARRPGTSPFISIPSKTPRHAALKSISLTNMNSVRAIQSATRAASQSHISGYDKLETFAQNKGPYTYRTVTHTRTNRCNNQPALPCLLQRRCIGLCPHQPVWSDAYS